MKSLMPFILKRTASFLAIYMAGIGSAFFVIQTFVDSSMSLDDVGFAFFFVSLYMFSDLVKMGAQFGYNRKTILKTQISLIILLSLASSLFTNAIILVDASGENLSLIKEIYGPLSHGATGNLAVMLGLHFLFSLASSMTGLALQTFYMRVGKIKFFIFLSIIGVSLAETFFPDGKAGYQRMSLFVEWLVRSPANPAMVCLATCVLMAAISFPIFKKAPLGLRPGKA